MNPHFRQRADPRETEDDLLQLQKEFLSSPNVNPAATLIRSSQNQRDVVSIDSSLTGGAEPVREQTSKKKKSIFAMRRDKANVSGSEKIVDMEAVGGGVIGQVRERKCSDSNFNRVVPATGFPEPVHRSQFPRGNSRPSENTNFDQAIAENNRADSNRSLYSEIHEENMKRIEGMTVDEIIEAQRVLRETYGKEIVEALLRRKPVSERPDPEAPIPKKKGEKSGTVRFKEDAEIIVLKDVEEQIPEEEHKAQKSESRVEDEEAMDTPQALKEKYFKDVPEEPEKLEWMGYGHSSTSKNHSQDINESDTPIVRVRFGFHGEVIDPSIPLPVFQGLHHHGEDPDQPGYTLSELLHLSRSQVPSQRVIPLNIITRIVLRAKRGEYSPPKLSDEILSYLIHLKAPTLVRICLDHRHDSVVGAAIQCMWAWMCAGDVTEELMDRLGMMERGYEGVALGSPSGVRLKSRMEYGIEINKSEDGTDERDMGAEVDMTIDSHAGIAARDLVAGWLKMNLLPRLRYLLDRCKLPDICNHQILEILLRIARHSPSSADMIAQVPKLLGALHQQFIDLTWPALEVSSAPKVMALRVLRVVCMGNRAAAEKIAGVTSDDDDGEPEVNNQVDSLLKFIFIPPEAVHNPLLAYELQVESLRLFEVLAAYGLRCDLFEQCFPQFSSWIQELHSLVSENPIKNNGNKQHEWKWIRVITLLRLLISLTHVASDTTRSTPAHSICWTQPTAFISLAVDMLTERDLMQETDNFKKYREQLRGALVGYVAAWCQYLDRNPPTDANMIKGVWTKLDQLRHACFAEPLGKVLQDFRDGWSRSRGDSEISVQVENLAGVYRPLAAAFCQNLVASGEIINAWLQHVKLAFNISRLGEKSALNKLISPETLNIVRVLREVSAEIMRYTNFGWAKYFSRHVGLSLCTWVRAIHLLFYADKEACDRRLTAVKEEEGKSIFHAYYGSALMALRVCDDEWWASFLLVEVVLHPPNLDNLLAQDSQENASEVVDALLPLFSERWSEYITHSRALCTQNAKGIKSLVTTLDPSYCWWREWALIPVDTIWKKKSTFPIESAALAVLRVANEVTGQYWASGIVSIMKLILLSDTIIRNDFIRTSIAYFLSSQPPPNAVDGDLELCFESTSNGLPFHRLFSDFAAQYAAISFGDTLFARLLVLPLSMHFASDYRLCVWEEQSDALSSISLRLNDIVRSADYFESAERDDIVLRAYMKAVARGLITKARNEFLYAVALHHLRRFCFDFGENGEDSNAKKLRQELAMGLVNNAEDEVLLDWIGTNNEASRSFELVESLVGVRGMQRVKELI
ncbi:uncharacterized protein VTP21DRAFT_2342 [Calcarisporiella thermophila]|uniref:uncharacterized protein n=1 Tax=Calcarisporiella thermophila TaxID=911321 RepID=UPI00374271C1